MPRKTSRKAPGPSRREPYAFAKRSGSLRGRARRRCAPGGRLGRRTERPKARRTVILPSQSPGVSARKPCEHGCVQGRIIVRPNGPGLMQIRLIEDDHRRRRTRSGVDQNGVPSRYVRTKVLLDRVVDRPSPEPAARALKVCRLRILRVTPAGEDRHRQGQRYHNASGGHPGQRLPDGSALRRPSPQAL